MKSSKISCDHKKTLLKVVGRNTANHHWLNEFTRIDFLINSKWFLGLSICKSDFALASLYFLKNKTGQATIFPPVEICLGELNETDTDKQIDNLIFFTFNQG